MSASRAQRLESQQAPTAPASGTKARRLRVLHLVEWLAMGGTEHGVRKLVQGLGEEFDEEFDNEIMTVRGCEESFSRTHFSDMLVHTPAFPASRFQVFRLARVIRSLRPDIVHSRNWGCIEAVLAARLVRVPVVVHSEHGYNPDMLPGLALRRRVVQRIAFGMADAVVAVSDDLRRFHARQAWLRPDHFRVLHNGVNTDRFRPRPEVREAYRERLAISPDAIVIGAVGRLVAIKDHGCMLRAAEILLAKGINTHVIMIGSGPESANLQGIVSSSPLLCNRVTFTGASEEIPELLNAMDVFVLASISEGLSNTLLEAMASGLCVVTSDAGGSPEVVQANVSGLLFRPGDVAKLSAALEQLAYDGSLRMRLGAAARERVLQSFSLDSMVRCYRNLYRELATRRGLLVDVGGDQHVRH